jgi:hypothetical protein
MCNRVRIHVQPGVQRVQVQNRETFAIITISDDIDSAVLRAHIEQLLDSEQCSCVMSLWGDDIYSRFFDAVDEGFSISCASLG